MPPCFHGHRHPTMPPSPSTATKPHSQFTPTSCRSLCMCCCTPSTHRLTCAHLFQSRTGLPVAGHGGIVSCRATPLPQEGRRLAGRLPIYGGGVMSCVKRGIGAAYAASGFDGQRPRRTAALAVIRSQFPRSLMKLLAVLQAHVGADCETPNRRGISVVQLCRLSNLS